MSTATELLRRIQRYIGNQYLTAETLELSNDIDDFLAAETEAEPVFIRPDHLALARKSPFLCRVEPKQRDDFIPLYTRPEPARKPMTEDEIDEELETNEYYCAKSFADGVRFAEKHHFGIGINPSDPDSIDLQSRCRGDKL